MPELVEICSAAAWITLLTLVGATVLERVHPIEDPLEKGIVGGSLGLLLVPYLAFVPAYFLHLFFEPCLLVGVAALVLVAMRRSFARVLTDRLGLRRLERSHASALVLLGCVGGIYFLKYDPTQLLVDADRYYRHESTYVCHHQLLFSMLAPMNPGADRMQLDVENASLPPPTNGNVAIVAAFVSVLGGAGYRFLFAWVPVLLAGLTYVLVRRLVGRWSKLGALLTVVNPLMFSAELLERSSLAMLVGFLMLYFLVVRNAGGLLVGAVLGIGASTGLRYLPATFGIGAALWYACETGRRREIAVLAVTFAIAFTPWAAQALIIGHSGPEPYTPRTLGPTHVALPTFLNFPSGADGMVRTPFFPFPPALVYLFHLVHTWGLPLVTLMALGAGVEAFRRPRLALLLLAMMLPTLVVLSLQAYWVSRSRMFISLTYSGVLVLLLCAGLGWLARRTGLARRLAVTLGLGIALAGGLRAMERLEFPLHPALLDDSYLGPLEHAYAESRRDVLTSLAVVPDVVGWLRPFYLAYHDGWRGHWWDLAYPSLVRPTIDRWASARTDNGPLHTLVPIVGDRAPKAPAGVLVPVRLNLSGALLPDRSDWFGVDSPNPFALGLPDPGQVVQLDFPAGRGQLAPFRVLARRLGPDTVELNKLTVLYDPFKRYPERRPRLHAGSDYPVTVPPPPSVLFANLSFSPWAYLGYDPHELRDIDLESGEWRPQDAPPGFGGSLGTMLLSLAPNTSIIVRDNVYARREGFTWFDQEIELRVERDTVSLDEYHASF